MAAEPVVSKQPVVTVIERRLQGDSVLREASQPIPLKSPKEWTLRWCNAEASPDHLWRYLHRLGWEYVKLADLDCSVAEIGAAELDTRIVRGQRSQEVLLKMRTEDYLKVQRKKSEENVRDTFGAKNIRDMVTNAVGAEHGDRAAEFVGKRMKVTDHRERVALNDEA